jgi:hypothetical protein
VIFPYLALAGQLHGGIIQSADQYTVLFGGDTSYGESYQKLEVERGLDNLIETKGYDYPFERLRPLLSSSDLVVINLETPITTEEVSPFEGRKRYIHKDDYVQAVAGLKRQNIQAVSLANNHALDYGKPGLDQTLMALRKNGIEFFGAGDNSELAGTPWSRTIRVGSKTVHLTVVGAFSFRPNYEHDFAFYAKEDRPGVYMLEEESIIATIRSVKKQYPEAFLVIYPHWGWNYRWRNQNQMYLAQRMIDAGADLIIGHGAHMLQEVERYQGRWIIYSIGNLVFASPGRYQKFKAPPFSLPARLHIKTDGGSTKMAVRLYPIVSDNQLTGYQPRPVNFAEFNRVSSLLIERSIDRSMFSRTVNQDIDDIGFYLEFALQGE